MKNKGQYRVTHCPLFFSPKMKLAGKGGNRMGYRGDWLKNKRCCLKDSAFLGAKLLAVWFICDTFAAILWSHWRCDRVKQPSNI